MYQENEKLILLQNVGIEGKDNFIPKDSEVIFVKAVDDPNNLARSMVIIQFEDRQLALPELAVRPVADKTINALKEFNLKLMESSPELKLYHHNRLFRLYHTIMFNLHRIFVEPFKRVISALTQPPKSDKKKEDKLVDEIKALMKEK